MKKNNVRWYLAMLLYALVIMFLCAGSSPFIKYLSPDSSIFYAMGRSMARGLTLYKDVADHKGFYLFLINGIGAFMTPGSMNGLFIIEVIFAFGKVLILYKIALLYLKDDQKAFLSAAIFMMISTNFLSWNTGNLGEQFALLFQLISLYVMALYFENGRLDNTLILPHKPIYMYIHGLCAGIVFFIRANLVAMWIPFAVTLAVLLFKNKFISNFLHNLWMLILGVGTAFFPVLAYGLANDCLNDMYNIMFEVNFVYSAAGRNGKTVYGYLVDFITCPCVIIVIMAVIGVLITYRFYSNRVIGIMLLFMLLLSIIFMSVSLTANPIFYTVYMPFVFPLCIWFTSMVQVRGRNVFVIECVIIAGITICANLQLVKKVFNMGTSGYVYESAYQMKNLMNDDDAQVLVLGETLFYNCTNTIPHIKYFTIFAGGLSYDKFPFCYDEQFNSLQSLENEYVIVQFNDVDSENFWYIEDWDERMHELLSDHYVLALDYNRGEVHSVLYKRID